MIDDAGRFCQRVEAETFTFRYSWWASRLAHRCARTGLEVG